MNGMTMKTLVAIIVALVVPATVWAIEMPHEVGSVKGYVCNSCHSTHNTLGSTGFNNVCQTCHKPGDAYGQKKPFRDADFANPFRTYTSARPGVIYQTSHTWVGKDYAPKAGAIPPADPALTKNIVAGSIVCARCHAIHYVYSSASNTKPFLRVRNDNDRMCLDCHRPRSTTDHTLGTHPVTMNYADKAAARPDDFYATPQNSNPANPTSAMRMSRNGAVVCTTCHGVHYTDSNSRTFDNASSARMGLLSTSRGFLLRTDLKGATVTDRNICTNCHKSANDPANTNARVKNHNGTKNQNVQCADCHGGHVDAADGTTPNVFLINRFMNISTQYGAVRNAKVLYQYTSVSQKNYNKDSFGVCVACHPALPPTISTHLTSTNAADCRSCHTHSQGFSANCTQCHGFPPQANVASGPSGYAKDGVRDYSTSGVFKDESSTPHISHAGGGSNYSFACDDCHKGFSHNTGSFQDVYLNSAGTKAAGNGATPAYNGTGSGTCSTTYCHSNGNGVYTSPTWANGKNTIIGLAPAARCGSCHSATPVTGAHNRHVSGGGSGKSYGCVNCHASTVSDNTTLLASARANGGAHVNTVKDKQFSGSVGGKALSGSDCSTVYCHSNGKGAAPVVAPVWGNPASGQCGACHRATGGSPINSDGHTAHLTAAYGPNFDETVIASCQKCHTYTGELDSTHVNGVIDVVAANCTTNCHKQSAVWTGGRVTCESCHTVPLSVIDGKTAPEKPNFTASGHGKAGANYDASRACSSCHDANSGHIDGISGNQKRTIGANDNTLCAVCHNDAAKVPTVTKRGVNTHATAKGTYDMDCKVCHDVHGTGNRGMVRTKITFGTLTSTITYATTADLVQLVPPYRGVCQSCHTATAHYKRGVNEGANHPTTNCLNCHSHKNTYAFKPRACDECHGYPPAPKGFVASQATYSSAKLENYSGGGGAHVKLGHLMANIRPTQGFTPCLACHSDGPAAHMGDDTIWTGGSTQSKKAPVTVKVDPTYKFNATKGQWYSQQAPDSTGSCWNVSCHFQPTPRWSNDK
ncbi:CxxxxCH/CxxCH domain-containing protein [Geobacter hydrogenophilus]|uniref:Cytochrome c n=1 Tax=Geobacter hydrogenophilus TaxID=40983 RepID=A0A9W6G199_9BACT|nr:CxxxxCH/CxxCH domain-containing protein [Geobacter hydrogenophilus]MBT0894130.1 CxxxxCH/CxxCH domain-containing protein [Geobacter hydrogenophilus]GLI38587.1 cytochrome c [Geobacter hydrogenophilus]